ncbi:MAG: hypothetical protein AMXMBFR33_03300 [Candidatus Xenobia bacterium]
MVATMTEISEVNETDSGEHDAVDSLVTPVELDPTGQTMLDTGGYLTLREAALAVDKSEQTIRRLVKARKVESRKVRTRTGFVYLVEPRSLRVACAAGGADLEPPLPPASPSEEGPASVPELSEYIRVELDRLREELQKERDRCEERTQELIAARTQAGRWEGMAQGFERFNQQLFQRLQLMEENPRPAPEVTYSAERPASKAASSGWLVWLVGVLAFTLAAGQMLALWQRSL